MLSPRQAYWAFITVILHDFLNYVRVNAVQDSMLANIDPEWVNSYVETKRKETF